MGGLFKAKSKIITNPSEEFGAEMSMESPRIVWYMKDGITHWIPQSFSTVALFYGGATTTNQTMKTESEVWRRWRLRSEERT